MIGTSGRPLDPRRSRTSGQSAPGPRFLGHGRRRCPADEPLGCAIAPHVRSSPEARVSHLGRGCKSGSTPCGHDSPAVPKARHVRAVLARSWSRSPRGMHPSSRGDGVGTGSRGNDAARGGTMPAFGGIEPRFSSGGAPHAPHRGSRVRPGRSRPRPLPPRFPASPVPPSLSCPPCDGGSALSSIAGPCHDAHPRASRRPIEPPPRRCVPSPGQHMQHLQRPRPSRDRHPPPPCLLQRGTIRHTHAGGWHA